MLNIIKNMTWKEKIDYIWTYYKVHIISVLIVLLLVGNLLNIYIFNPAPKEYVSISFMGDYIAQEQLDLFDQTLNEHILPKDAGNVTATSYCFYESNDPSMSMALQQKFMALTSVGGIDVIVATKSEFDDLMKLDYFVPLDTIFSSAELNPHDDAFIKNKDNALVGIQLQSSDILAKIGYDSRGKIIGICVNSKKITESKDAVNDILGVQ